MNKLKDPRFASQPSKVTMHLNMELHLTLALLTNVRIGQNSVFVKSTLVYDCKNINY